MDEWNNGKNELSFPIVQYSSFLVLIFKICNNYFAHNILYYSPNIKFSLNGKKSTLVIY